MATKRKRHSTKSSDESPDTPLTPDAVRTMVTGALFSKPLVVRLVDIRPTGNDSGAVQALVCDHKYTNYGIDMYVLNEQRLREDGSYVVSVDGYVTTQASTKDAFFVCITSLEILSVQQSSRRQNNQRSRSLQLQQQRIHGGNAGSFLLDRAPLFSNEQLSGQDAWCSSGDTSTKTVKDFLARHAAMKTLQEHNDPQAGNYMSAVREFASAQLDRQKASLTTNAGPVSANRAAQVTTQYRTALEAALAHADTRQELTIETLKQWHALLCGGGLVPEAGRLRTKKVRAGPTDFCPVEQVPRELEKCCQGIRALEARLASTSPTTLAAAVCFGILDIHPFSDGNGRLARIAANWALRRVCGLPFTITVHATPVQRQEYIKAIQQTRRNLNLVARGNVDEETLVDVTARSGLLLPLVRLITDLVARAAQECGKLVTEKSQLITEEQEARAARRFREKAAASTCLICFDDSPNVATLCCGKAVHLNCIAEWLSSRNSCPQCRAELPSLPARVAAPTNNNNNNDNDETTDGYMDDGTTEDESTNEDTTSTTNDIPQQPPNDETTTTSEDDETVDVNVGHHETDETTEDVTEDDSTTEYDNPPPQRDTRPFCLYCRNRSAAECSNSCCGRCCVLHGQYRCDRHGS